MYYTTSPSTVYQQKPSADYTTAQVRPYDNVFLDEILENDFPAYYASRLNGLVAHYKNKEVSLTEEQAAPFLNINELL
jgi:hypothetical protein